MLRPEGPRIGPGSPGPTILAKKKCASGFKKTQTFHLQVPEAALGAAAGVLLGRGHSPFWCQLAWAWEEAVSTETAWFPASVWLSRRTAGVQGLYFPGGKVGPGRAVARSRQSTSSG